MKTLHHLGPSPEHAEYAALMPEFWRKTKKQEADAVKRGLPAKGMYDFGQTWFNAWATQSVDPLRDCMADNCSFIDSSTFQKARENLEETLANCAACFETFPDTAFYAQDGTNKSLPYADYFEGEWRMVIPWRGIARWTGPLRVPGTTSSSPQRSLPELHRHRPLHPDRRLEDHPYRHRLGHALRWHPAVAGGCPCPGVRTLKAASLAARVAMPALRLLGGDVEGHRRFEVNLPTVTRPEAWTTHASA